MSAAHIQIVKWSFPAFALIIGLLWYRRRRVDRTDPGGINTPDNNEKNFANRKKEVVVSSKSNTNFYDSGIQFDETSSLNSSNQLIEEIVCSPRKRSESLDIPMRKTCSQSVSAHSRVSCKDDQAWYSYLDTSASKMEIQLGSNPKMSNFEMVVRSRSSSSLENVPDTSSKVLKIFDHVVEEEEQKLPCENNTELDDKPEKSDANNECNYLPSKELSVSTPLKETAKTPAQALSERDSANHSPVSGVLEGSVTDEARSEGSTDSGKGNIVRRLK